MTGDPRVAWSVFKRRLKWNLKYWRRTPLFLLTVQAFGITLTLQEGLRQAQGDVGDMYGGVGYKIFNSNHTAPYGQTLNEEENNKG